MDVAEQGVLFPVIEEKLTRRSPVRTFLDASAEHGGLVPPSMLVRSLGVSKQRIHQLMDAGRLVTVTVDGKRYVTACSLELFLTEERRNGRHLVGATLAGK